MRGIAGRSGLVAMVVVLLLGACSDGPDQRSAGSGSESPQGKAAEEGSPAASIAAAEPLVCTGDPVVSARAANSGQPATATEIQARLLVDDTEAPAGFRRQTVVVDEGLGSFRFAAPLSFSPVWRNGTPSGELIDLARERDEVWAEFWEDRTGSGALTRAISLDTGRRDEVVAVLITLTEAFEETGDELAASFAESYGSEGSLLGESCGVRANGAEGAYVEHTVTSSTLGGGEDRTQFQFLIPDPPNRALWGLTCDVPRPMASDVKELCRQIASTFEPLPEVVT